MKLKYSLISALLISCLIPCVIGFYFLVSYINEHNKQQVENNLLAITQIARNRILSSVDRIKDNTALVSSRTQMRKSLYAHQQQSDPAQLALINKIILDAALSIANIVEISIFDKRGLGIATTLNIPSNEIATDIPKLPFVTLQQNNGITVLTGYDQLTLNGEFIGIIKLSVAPDFIREIVQSSSGLGLTGEWIVAKKDAAGNALFVSPTRYNNAGAFKRTVEQSALQTPITQALLGNEEVMWDSIDYAGNIVVAATRYIPEYEWGIVAKIHQEEVFASNRDITNIFWAVSIAIIVIAVCIGILLVHFITRPIEQLTQQVKTISENPSIESNIKLTMVTRWIEVQRLTGHFNQLLSHISALNTSLNHKIEERTAQLAASNENLEQEKNKAINATQAKTQFLANMSHEVRTPLNSIHGSLQLLARQPLPLQATNLIKTAQFSMESLLGIINDVLDFSKIEDNSIALESTAINMTQLVHQLISELGVLAAQKGLSLEVVIAPGYKEGWLGDPMRIKQILTNFISNAIKFTATGKITINIDSQNYSDNPLLILTVNDTGKGMTDNEITTLFDRFSQASNSTSREFGGTGLGMAISLSLVQLMNGTIEVDSKVNQGTKITTRLPLPITELPMDSRLASTTIDVPDLSGLTILLAEDNEINQLIFCSMLEETQAQVQVVADGEKAVAAYTQCPPDIIFLDIFMPVMDGITACKLIREQSTAIPIVSITANITQADIEHYAQSGFDHHIGKPVDLVDLYQLVSNIQKRIIGNNLR